MSAALRTVPATARPSGLPFRVPGAWRREVPRGEGDAPCAGSPGFAWVVAGLEDDAHRYGRLSKARRRADARALTVLRATFCDQCPLTVRDECAANAADVSFEGVADGSYWSGGVRWSDSFQRST